MEDKKNSVHKQAKLDLLHDLRKMAMGMINSSSGDDSSAEHMNKVTVAAKDKESLQQGLEKAKEIVQGSEDESLEDPSEEDSETSEEESAEGDEESTEALQAKIEELKAKLAKKNK